MKQLLLSIGIFFQLINTVQSQTSYTWNGTISTSWNIAGNWTPNGIPGNADNVIIAAGANICILSANSGITNFTLAGGTIDLGGGTLTVNGANAIFNSGTVQNGGIIVPGAATTTFGAGAVTMNCKTNITSATVTLTNTTFQDSITITKTGAVNDISSGNNIFNGVAIITNAGAGYLMFGSGNPDRFNAAATFNNKGSNDLWVAYNSTNNFFGGVTTFNNSPVTNNGIYASWNSAGTVFGNNIIVNSTSGAGVQFCGGNTTATASLSAGNTITIGGAGFSAGILLLRQFMQTGATAQNLTLTGGGNLTFGPSARFDGDMTTISPSLFFNGATFNGSTNCTKTGSSGDVSQGGNIFNGICSLTNSGSSNLTLGNLKPDTWNNDVTFTDNGSDRILPCWATAGNKFNGNIYVNTSGSATGIQFCGGNATATATLAATKSIQTGTAGFKSGYLFLKQFTQLGSAANNLILSSTATYLQYGPNSTFGGSITSSSPGLFFSNCIFNDSVNFTKTGPTSDVSNGSNVFNGVTVMNNIGPGYLMLGSGYGDRFNSAATFNNTGANTICVAYNSTNNVFNGITTFSNTPSANGVIYVSPYSAGTTFNGDIIVNSTNGQGVQFCSSSTTASVTLAANRTISTGSGVFSAGVLLLKQFTQTGATAQSITLTGTGNLTFGPSSSFGGNVTTVSPSLYYNGCYFAGTVTSLKNGSSSDGSTGGNTFNGAFSITNTGNGSFTMGSGNPDLWQSTATFNNFSPKQHMYVAYNSTGNIFNGDVVFNNQPGLATCWIYPNYYGINTIFNGNISLVNVNGAGISFGTGGGTAILSSGSSMSTGAGGFNSGGIIFKNFTQSGLESAQNITTTGTSFIQYGNNASFDGPVTSSSPGLFFNGCVFNGSVNCTKTGSSGDQSQGNNIFNGSSTFINNGPGSLLMTATTPDAYNGDVTFVNSGTGGVYPNYIGSSTYAGNLTVTSSSAITFGANGGTAVFSGSGGQSISATGATPAPVFTRLVIANTGSGVSLNNTSVKVSGNLTLTSGLLNTTTTNMLTMLNGSTTAAGNALSTSFVNGPMQYQKSSAGASTLNFPIGNGAACRPVVLTVNHASTNLYTYQARLSDTGGNWLGYTMPPSVDAVSHFHYYTISRVDARSVSQPVLELNGNQTIQLFFGDSDLVINGATLTIVKNTYLAPSNWINIGGTGGPAYNGGANLTGSITSTSSPSAFNSFSTFALADQLGGGNVLPVKLLHFDVRIDMNKVDLTWTTASESNNSYFTVEKCKDGINFEFLQKVGTHAINGNSSIPLDYTAYDQNPYDGVNYYRLKQTDLDGNSTYSDIRLVNFDKKNLVSVYPNPTTGTVYISGIDANLTVLTVEWYDASGRLLGQETASVQNGTARLDPHFRNGVYFLKFVSSDGGLNLRNIIIMK